MILYAFFFGVTLLLGLTGCNTVSVDLSPKTLQRIEKSPNYRDGKFHNLSESPSIATSIIELTTDALFQESNNSVPPFVPKYNSLSKETLDSLDCNSNFVIRLCHSTVLLKIQGKYILTDPIFSNSPSPFSLVHLQRFHPSPISIENLPEIDIVIISHDHYDHLDRPSIEKLIGKVKHFVTPLAVGDYLREWGVQDELITELDWWESVAIEDFIITATPARHGSGRGISDNHTLWASFCIYNPEFKFFYSGDTGIMPTFSEIGNKYGPFDLTMIQLGAYSEHWAYMHMTPEEAVEVHKMVYGNYMLPVHWGTFNLAYHAWDEPIVRAKKAANAENISLITALPGEVTEIKTIRQLAEKKTEGIVENEVIIKESAD